MRCKIKIHTESKYNKNLLKKISINYYCIVEIYKLISFIISIILNVIVLIEADVKAKAMVLNKMKAN